MKPYISIIIPTLNEERNMRRLIEGIKGVLKNKRLEIIVVDGHSKDKTVEISRRMGARILYDDVGKGSALITGLKAADGKVVISMDADMSHRPNELLILIAGIESGYDVCMGSRFLTGGGSDDMPFIRKVGNKAFVGIVNLIYKSNYSDMCYGYRSFSKNALKRLKLKEAGFGIETEISIKAKKMNLKVLEVPSYEKKRFMEEPKLRSINDGFIILRTIIHSLLE